MQRGFRKGGLILFGTPLFWTPCLHEELYKNKRAITLKERRTKGSFRCNAQWLPDEAQDADGGIRDRVIDSREEKDGS